MSDGQCPQGLDRARRRVAAGFLTFTKPGRGVLHTFGLATTSADKHPRKDTPVRKTRIVIIAIAAVAALLSAIELAAAQTAPTSAGPVPAEAIEDLVTANRILHDRGIIDAFGHVSIRHPANPNRYLMARAIAPGLVTADDIMEFDLDSNPLDRRGRSMFVERFIHGEIYKVRPDVNSVIHTHSMRVIPFSVTQVPLKPIFGNAAFLHPSVPIFEIRDAGGATDLRVRNPALGKALATALGDRAVALLRGHGNVVVGQNVRVAVSRAVYTDDNARLQAIALSLGGPINYISPEEAALRVTSENPSRPWELWKAMLTMKAPQ
jgi:HCOMODA/2-hydroxy-3-carboxy-muconic semialdehyde decarboxylase